MNIKAVNGAVVIQWPGEMMGLRATTMLRVDADRIDELLAACMEAKGCPLVGSVWVGFEGDDEVLHKVNAITFAMCLGVEFSEHRNGLYIDDDFYMGVDGWNQWVRETKAKRVEAKNGN